MPAGVVLPPPQSPTTSSIATPESDDLSFEADGEPDDSGESFPGHRPASPRPSAEDSPSPHQRSLISASQSTLATDATTAESLSSPHPAPPDRLSPSNVSIGRPRHSAGPLRRSLSLTDAVDSPGTWGDDTLDFSTHIPDLDESFLSAIADEDFSSPSSYPSFNQRQARPPAGPHHVARNLGSCNPHRPLAAASRSDTQLTHLTASTSTYNSQDTPLTSQHCFDEVSVIESPASSFSETMPNTRKRRPTAEDTRTATPTANKRRRTSKPEPRPSVHANATCTGRQHHASKDLDDIFDESPEKAPGGDALKQEDCTTVDLVDADEVPEELCRPHEDKRTKISAFQCAICMDDVKTLTVTHCGHLYCAQCLHMSLHVEPTRGKCPMCRAKVDMKPREAYNTKTKGFWPLELKLMTATRKGKRKADVTS